MATVDKENLLNEENLRSAFNAFDHEKKGELRLQEVKKIFSFQNDVTEEVWQQIMREVGLNANG
jgi:Ca2+-binding EF-hand superfamily protein